MPNRNPSDRLISRRRFVQGSLAAAAMLAPGRGAAAGRADQATGDSPRRPSANERLRVAVVGAGGRGGEDLKGLRPTGAQIVALCDCDSHRAANAFRNYPDARRYSDWRKLLEAAKDFDAVVVATPDHNHAVVAVAAMKLGKHIYCEKPLAHSIGEVRQMAKAAADHGVATQMGTQGHAYEGTRRAVEVIRSGVLGEVRELHVWTDRPKDWWPQGRAKPAETPPVPEGLDWDLWLGPAPYRPYHPVYVPITWRGFWDFGTGPLGDMGVHNSDTAFWGLQLTAPTSVKIKHCSPALTDPSDKQCPPLWSILEFQFPARPATPHDEPHGQVHGPARGSTPPPELPPVKMTWYDGGKLPPAELFHGEPIPTVDGGSLVVGSKGSLLTRTWHGGLTDKDMFVLLPRKQFQGYRPPAPTLPRVSSHYHEWVAACRGEGKPLSNFGYASVLTESLLLGDLALRVGKDIQWDADQMRAVNCPEAEPLVTPKFREGWTM